MASLLLTPQRQAPNGPFLKGSRSGQKQPQAVSSLEFELRLSLRIPRGPKQKPAGLESGGRAPHCRKLSAFARERLRQEGAVILRSSSQCEEKLIK